MKQLKYSKRSSMPYLVTLQRIRKIGSKLLLLGSYGLKWPAKMLQSMAKKQLLKIARMS